MTYKAKINPKTGTKGRQKKSLVDREYKYKLFRYDVPVPYAQDVDMVEYRFMNGKPVPVAVLELTLFDDKYNKPVQLVPDAYLEAILKRYNTSGQGKFTRMVADKLGCHAWIVLYDWKLTGFQLYNLTTNLGWFFMSPVQYKNWLHCDCDPDMVGL